MIGSLGGSGDTLNRLHSMVEEDREKAAGRARVARDSLDTRDIHIKEAEQNALADQALADFAAKEGHRAGAEGCGGIRRARARGRCGPDPAQ